MAFKRTKRRSPFSPPVFTDKVGLAFLLMLGALQVHQVQSIDILGALVDFKENLFNGILGKGKCGCPCRDYYVPKCEYSYVEQCSYEHYQQVCNQVAVPTVIQAKEVECSRCRRYEVPVQTVEHVLECNPVYDEECHTDYQQICKEEVRCHDLYKTVCRPLTASSSSSSGSESYPIGGGYSRFKRGGGYEIQYGQTCASEPRQHCYPEVKCHRSPMTKCHPVKFDNCAKVPKDTIVYQTETQCLPYEITQEHLDRLAATNPCHHQHGPQSHYSPAQPGGTDAQYGPPYHRLDHHQQEGPLSVPYARSRRHHSLHQPENGLGESFRIGRQAQWKPMNPKNRQ